MRPYIDVHCHIGHEHNVRPNRRTEHRSLSGADGFSAGIAAAIIGPTAVGSPTGTGAA